MKLIREELAGNGKERFVFHIGRDEIRILNGILTGTYRHMPRTTETLRLVSTLNQMRREFSKAMQEPQAYTSRDALMSVTSITKHIDWTSPVSPKPI